MSEKYSYTVDYDDCGTIYLYNYNVTNLDEGLADYYIWACEFCGKEYGFDKRHYLNG